MFGKRSSVETCVWALFQTRTFSWCVYKAFTSSFVSSAKMYTLVGFLPRHLRGDVEDGDSKINSRKKQKDQNDKSFETRLIYLLLLSGTHRFINQSRTKRSIWLSTSQVDEKLSNDDVLAGSNDSYYGMKNVKDQKRKTEHRNQAKHQRKLMRIFNNEERNFLNERNFIALNCDY